MKLNSANFVNYVDTDTQYVNFKDYLDQMGALGTWGDNLEIIALSEYIKGQLKSTISRLILETFYLMP